MMRPFFSMCQQNNPCQMWLWGRITCLTTSSQGANGAETDVRNEGNCQKNPTFKGAKVSLECGKGRVEESRLWARAGNGVSSGTNSHCKKDSKDPNNTLISIQSVQELKSC
jgi:hypothetical protein